MEAKAILNDCYEQRHPDESIWAVAQRAMKQYAEAKCAVQRQHCFEAVEISVDDDEDDNFHIVINKASILEAPAPDFE